MAGSVLIKSYNRGLSIHLDPDADMDVIKEDLAAKLKESAAFFKDATIAVSFEDRDVDSRTERELVNVITSSSSIKVACVAGKNKLVQDMITNALDQLEFRSEVKMDVEMQVIKETIKDGRVLEVPGSLLILGDVYPGTAVVAGGDIIVYGALRGQAYAGNNGDAGRIICALDMNPEKLRIAGIKHKPKEKPKWTIRSKSQPVPKMAHLVETEIVMSTIDGDFWKRFNYGSVTGEE